MEERFIEKYEELVKLDDLKGLTKQMKQQRGRDFEDLINEIFGHEKVLLSRGYHTSDNNAEQIDGAIDIDNRIFLIEVKWVKSNLAASELYSFIGKIENKFIGTLGVFISKEKLTDNFINSLNKGRRQSVIVMHGNDIDTIFTKHAFKLKDYISHVIKLISYDNKTHFSFKDYLAIKGDGAATTFEDIANSDSEWFKIIEEKLIKGILTEESLILKLEELTSGVKDKIYKFIVLKYSEYWENGFNSSNFTVIQNFDLFLRYYEPSQDLKNELAIDYYSKLIKLNISIYHRDVFNSVFSQCYSVIPKEAKDTFEYEIKETLKVFNKNSNWNGENYVTEIISPIWELLKQETQEELKGIYLNIYVRDTSDKFVQKKFANMLVEKKVIKKEFVEKWLENEISNFLNSNEDEESLLSVDFIARTYFRLNNILKVETETWREYVTERLRY